MSVSQNDPCNRTQCHDNYTHDVIRNAHSFFVYIDFDCCFLSLSVLWTACQEMSNDKLVDGLLIALFHGNKPGISILWDRSLFWYMLSMPHVKPYHPPLQFNAKFIMAVVMGLHTICQSLDASKSPGLYQPSNAGNKIMHNFRFRST